MLDICWTEVDEKKDGGGMHLAQKAPFILTLPGIGGRRLSCNVIVARHQSKKCSLECLRHDSLQLSVVGSDRPEARFCLTG
jgi:hypothetical protein